MRLGGRALAVRAAAVLGALVVAVALGEAIVRVAAPMPRYEMRGLVLELDRTVLFRLVDAGSEPVNADGYRDRSFPDGPSRGRRVLVVGDSFVMGYNVPVDATLPRALGRLLGGDWEVRNHGLYGYGPDQTFLRLRDEGMALEPHAVVLVLFPANDFRDLWKNGLVELRSDGLAWSRENPVRRALPRSRLVGLVRERVSGSQLVPAVERDLFVRLFADAYDVRLATDDPEVRWKTAAMQAVLTAYRDLLVDAGVRFQVVVVPSWEAMAAPEWFAERGLSSAAARIHEDRTVALCRSLGIEVLDLRDVWDAHGARDTAYDATDHHLSEHGNALAARAIADRLLADRDP